MKALLPFFTDDKGCISRAVVQRIAFLSVANLVLLLIIRLLLKDGASFSSVLRRCGADLAPVMIAGLGMTGIIFTGAIDLSIASIVAVAATVFGILVYYGTSALFCYIGCFFTGWLLAMVNSQLVVRGKLPAIIATLAGLPLYRGLALIVADLAIRQFGGNISVQDEIYHGPGKQYPVVILLFVIAAALLWERFAKTPRNWLGLGSSEEACRLVGMNPSRIIESAFAVHGVFIGLAALLYATRVQAIEPARIALGFELQVIGAVVLGGTNIFGGEGSYLGTILGSCFLYLISQVLTYAGASPYSQDAIAGAVIVAVIGIDCVLHRSRKLVEELA